MNSHGSIANEDDLGLSDRIKQFLAKDSSFRDTDFNPAPYLIKILKQKDSSHELLIKRQSELVEMENGAQQLVADIVEEHSGEMLKLMHVPSRFGEQLEKLKNRMSNVKKKIKEGKMQLQNTQKDIQQIHLNCMFNKIIYKQLKQIQLKLQQYESASLALKNNLYLQCAENLPIFEGDSVLEGALAARSENLRLRFVSQSIEELRAFLYYSCKPWVVAANVLIERADDDVGLENVNNNYRKFHERFTLFKKALCEQYLQHIWKFDDLEQKGGKVALVDDIVKGVLRIGKISEITQAMDADCQKSLTNVFYVLSYFYTIEFQEDPRKEDKGVKWFFSQDYEPHKKFISAVLCVCGALLRKFIILERIYKQYMITGLTLNSGRIYDILIDEVLSLLCYIYFPGLVYSPKGAVKTQEDIIFPIKRTENFIFWPYVKESVQNSFLIIRENLVLFEMETFEVVNRKKKETDLYDKMQLSFFTQFHSAFVKALIEIFTSEGKPFNSQSFEHIVLTRSISQEEVLFCQSYASEERKAFKEYIHYLSMLHNLQAYFLKHQFDLAKYKKYVCFSLFYFYLRLNHHIYKSDLPLNASEAIFQCRSKDIKVKSKEKALEINYNGLVDIKDTIKLKEIRKGNKGQEAGFSVVRCIEKLKVFKIQNQMLLTFLAKFLKFPEEAKREGSVLLYLQQIEKLEASSYDTNISLRISRIWEVIPDPEQQINQAFAAVAKKIMDLHESCCAYIYLETGIY